jgi:hypothetical protein
VTIRMTREQFHRLGGVTSKRGALSKRPVASTRMASALSVLERLRIAEERLSEFPMSPKGWRRLALGQVWMPSWKLERGPWHPDTGLLNEGQDLVERPLGEAWIARKVERLSGEWSVLVERPTLQLVVDNASCPTTNATRHGVAWIHARNKERLWNQICSQARVVGPLPDRVREIPLVRLVRWSNGKGPDPLADWPKLLVDMLQEPDEQVKEHRLGVIRSDANGDVDLACGWDWCPKGEGFVWCGVWT